MQVVPLQMRWLCTDTSDAEAVTTMQSRAHRHRVRVKSNFLWFMMYAPLKYQGSFQWGTGICLRPGEDRGAHVRLQC